ncbi:Rhodanese-like protein [Macrolepiota fuliginosa MF-IS2]|uniref:Rhodanese-like protein n=1 Tax=Macrolepiota fuliginosa MF-IS2 TaxID=1400762 RepID=A0A9P5XLK1_9AGAR|nr:Rhodanese-like protein [Macrolepiota fuliginosa MF-IS2]
MASLLRRTSARLLTTSQRWLSTSTTDAPLLLSPKQVHELSKSEPVALLDVSWFMPNSTRDAKVEFINKRLPGAQFLDLDQVASTHELGLKHMMPEPRVFAEACGRFGIQPSSQVVIYDSHGVFSSPRALFMFRAFGHQKSSILNGGLPRWIDEGLPLEGTQPQTPRVTNYAEPILDEHMIRSYEQMVSNSSLDPTKDSSAELVLDARSKERYTGTAAEPRPGLSSGHIPNSFSLPFNTFLQKQISNSDGSEYTTFLPQDALRRVLEGSVGHEQAQLIINGKKPIVTTCGSGMTAGVLWLGLRLLGVKNIALYDESWTGYAMRPSSQIVKN